ncbi:MAG: substrate-binding periplasmic protein [Pseudomonadota bacterium]
MRLGGFLSLTLAFVLSVASPASVSDDSIRISTGKWPPYLDETEADDGFLAEIIRESFANEGVEVEFVFLPWSRALAMVETHKYDASAVWSCTESRSYRFVYSEPILPYQYVFYHRAQDDFDWSAFTDLRGKVIGLTQDYSYGQTLKGFIASGLVQADTTTSDLANFHKLLMGRIDLFPMDPVVGEAMINSQLNGYASRLAFHPKPLRSAFYHLVFDKDSAQAAQLKTTFDRGFQALRKSGRYRNIIETALEENSSRTAAEILEGKLVEWEEAPRPCVPAQQNSG